MAKSQSNIPTTFRSRARATAAVSLGAAAALVGCGNSNGQNTSTTSPTTTSTPTTIATTTTSTTTTVPAPPAEVFAPGNLAVELLEDGTAVVTCETAPNQTATTIVDQSEIGTACEGFGR